MSVAVGIMQGRLSPPDEGRIQSFPVATWAVEFERANAAGLHCIEWIYEAGTDDRNPMATDEGIAEIKRLTLETSVGVRSVCADYYMCERLVSPSGELSEASVGHLRWLIGRAGTLGVAYMVLPFVDSSSLRTHAQREGVLSLMQDVARDAERSGIELHLETDLPPARLARLLDEIAHPSVRANYDIGNSASLGYDPDEELPAIGRCLGSVHVKDRLRGGATVPLGTGSANLAACFRHFARMKYDRPFILQVARGVTGDEVAWAAGNRATVERLAAAAGY